MVGTVEAVASDEIHVHVLWPSRPSCARPLSIGIAARFISPCHCAEQLYRRSRRAQHLHSLVGALVAAGGEGDHETFEIAGFGRVIMQLIDQGPASGIVPTKPIVGALRDLAGHPLPLPPDESPGAGAVPYAAPPADHASPTAM